MRKIFLLFTIFLLGISYASADFSISEVFPNTNDDKNLEYIQIKNQSEQEENLYWYYIEDASKKRYEFWDILVASGDTKDFLRSETKIILNNSNESLTLFDSAGNIISSRSYNTSIKWELISFSDKEESSQKQEVKEWNDSDENMKIEENFKLELSLQRPSYVSLSGSTNVYICDTSKEACKVNLDLSESFNDRFKSWDYTCKIDFWLWKSTGQENKCNPNTVIFPQWETPVNIRIYEKKNWNLFHEEEFIFIFDTSLVAQEVKEDSARIYIWKPHIIVQSGLTRNGDNFYCKKRPCKINLNYKKVTGWEACYWNFWPWIASSKTTKKRCNPWYVEIPEGSFELQLKVYEKNFPRNKKITKFYVHNILEDKEEKIPPEVSTWKNEGENEIQEIESVWNFEILLQWKLSSEKIHKNNTLVCKNVSKCYVNLTAVHTGSLKSNLIVWKHNDIEFHAWNNPKGIWIDAKENIITATYNEWDEEISRKFTVYLYEDIKPGKKNFEEPVLFSDEIKKEKLPVAFTQNFLVLKYDGLRISGKAPVNSEVIVYLKEKEFARTKSNEKWKYRIVTKNIKPGNYGFSTRIINGNEQHTITQSGDTEILSSDILYWYKKKTRKWSQTKKKKTPYLTLKSEDVSHLNNTQPANPQEISFIEHVIFLIGICMSVLLCIFHIMMYKKNPTEKNSMGQCYQLMFETRGRVILNL